MTSHQFRVTVTVILVQAKILCMSLKTVDSINEIFVRNDTRGSYNAILVDTDIRTAGPWTIQQWFCSRIWFLALWVVQPNSSSNKAQHYGCWVKLYAPWGIKFNHVWIRKNPQIPWNWLLSCYEFIIELNPNLGPLIFLSGLTITSLVVRFILCA